MKKICTLFTLILFIISCNKEKKSSESQKINAEKIVSLSGAITETLVELGYEKKIVGVDVTSTYPERIKKQTVDLGHNRSISTESILALQPTVVFGTTKDLKPTLTEQLKKANIPTIIIDKEYSVTGTQYLIKKIAEILGNKDYEKLNQHIENKVKTIKLFDKKPKVLFIYARGTGTMMVAGKETPMHHMIELAGGENAASAITNYKPLTPEGLLTTNPDVLLLFNSGLKSLGGADGLLQVQGISITNAGKNKKIISMDGQLLSGFGPRLGEAIAELNSKIH